MLREFSHSFEGVFAINNVIPVVAVLTALVQLAVVVYVIVLLRTTAHATRRTADSLQRLEGTLERRQQGGTSGPGEPM